MTCHSWNIVLPFWDLRKPLHPLELSPCAGLSLGHCSPLHVTLVMRQQALSRCFSLTTHILSILRLMIPPHNTWRKFGELFWVETARSVCGISAWLVALAGSDRLWQAQKSRESNWISGTWTLILILQPCCVLTTWLFALGRGMMPWRRSFGLQSTGHDGPWATSEAQRDRAGSCPTVQSGQMYSDHQSSDGSWRCQGNSWKHTAS